MIFDCHAHLLHNFYAERLDEVALECKKRNVVVINHAVNLSTSREVLATFEKFEWVKPAVGVSPYDAVKNPAQAEELANFARENKDKIVAIGEVGLDLHHFKIGPEFDKQVSVFTQMLELATELKKPIVIHSRKAENEVLDMLKSFDCTKVMHCFLVEKLLEKALDANCFISVPTLKSRDRVRIMEKAPFESLVFETDSPYLWQGENKPWNVESCYEMACEVKKTELRETVEKINSNAKKAFKL